MSEIKYCTDCGNQMDKSIEICPECGVKQPVTVKAKYCVNCGSRIDEKAEICPDCGVRQPNTYRQTRTTSYQAPMYQQKNPGIAAVLSALFVEFGQIYNGQIAKGLIFMVVYFVSILLIFVLIGFITTPLLWIFGIYDAYNTANRINAGEIVV